MTPYQVNQYLAANGITVGGRTDNYYRLGEAGIKAWYVDGVSEPTEQELAAYPEIDAVRGWLLQMAASDASLPRWAEDLWDAVGIQNAPASVQAKHAEKKSLRAQKP